ncbi:hypothetical protein [Leptotrichia trevisanii]|uniref:hypothetical protein n=1 Tax=Leptotrichia trevisanii TaxID=109328 RepID=UPI000422852B|nr:hypothetical protein [Leptotrichia trevisanii]
MSWKCKKCGSDEHITVIETINYHNCKLDKDEEIKNHSSETTDRGYWCENCNNEAGFLEDLADWRNE